MEEYLKEAIGLSRPQIILEPLPKIEVEPQPQVSIYDFADLLLKNEPPKIEQHRTNTVLVKIQLL